MDAKSAFYGSCANNPGFNVFADLIDEIDQRIRDTVKNGAGFGVGVPLHENKEIREKMQWGQIERLRSLIRYYEAQGYRVSPEMTVSQSGRILVSW